MADSVTIVEPAVLNSWSGENVSVREVLDALDELRRPERLPATRRTVLTLVVVAAVEERAAWADRAVLELGGRHPARTLTLLPRADEPAGLDAEVQLLGAEADGRKMWFEHVELSVRGPGARHLDSLIEPFTVADLPVVVWFAGRLPEDDEPLLSASDLVLVDSRQFGDVACFRTVSALAARRPVLDLSWARLLPWRSLLASLFDAPDYAPFLDGVRSVHVRGKTGPRHLLAGWIASRLNLSSHVVHLDDAEHVGLRLLAEHNGGTGEFSVERPGDDRTVLAVARIEGGPETRSAASLTDASPSWGLTEALGQMGRDAVYEAALSTVLRFWPAK